MAPPLDVEFKDLAAKVAATLIDFDLMSSEPYFSDEDVESARRFVTNQLDGWLHARGTCRELFLRRLTREKVFAANYIRAIFDMLDTEEWRT